MLEKKEKLSRLDLNALVWKEGRLFVAKAIEVEVASQGKSKREAIDNLEEALDLYFEDKKKPRTTRYSNLELIKVSPESRRLYA